MKTSTVKSTMVRTAAVLTAVTALAACGNDTPKAADSQTSVPSAITSSSS